MSTRSSVEPTASPLSIPDLGCSWSLLEHICYSARTLFLFTYTDFKTIVFPVTAFACVAAPVHCPWRLLHGLVWIWLHLLQCNVSNQYKSALEDVINRPWRPIPSGRVSADAAQRLRWCLVPICLLISARHDAEVVWASATLSLTTILYDEVGLARHFVGKSISAVPGYVAFEVGATKILASHALDNVARVSILYSALVVSTTIHVQDFADIAGDRVLGRVTIPLWLPNGSRLFTLLALPTWTAILCRAWKLGTLTSLLLGVLGTSLGYRIYTRRDTEADKKSYIWYNVWLMIIHILPAHARWGICYL